MDVNVHTVQSHDLYVIPHDIFPLDTFNSNDWIVGQNQCPLVKIIFIAVTSLLRTPLPSTLHTLKLLARSFTLSITNLTISVGIQALHHGLSVKSP